MRRHTVTLAALLPVLVALTACTAPPTATPPTTSTSASPPPATDTRPRLPIPTSLGPPKVDLPPRPYEIRLDGRDPCAVLTPEQRNQLGLDRPPIAYETDAYNYAASCSFRDSKRGWGTSISLAIDIGGIETFTRTDLFRVRIEPAAVRAFPALLVLNDAVPARCEYLIDVAPSQVLSVTANDPTINDAAVQETLCQQAKAAADQALTSLSRR